MQLQATATIEHDAPAAQRGVRLYRALDEPHAVEVLKRSLRRWTLCSDALALWRWKHFANPFGPSSVLVHEAADGAIAGVVALMFWRLRQGKRVVLAERTTELATDPDYRRQGVASSFWGPSQRILRDAGVGLVFHTPNQYSLPFTRHSLRPVFRMRPRVALRHPAALAKLGLRRQRRRGPDGGPDTGAWPGRAMPVVRLFDDRPALADLVAQDAVRRGPALQTARTVEYLYWRYAAHPTIRYSAVAVESGSRLDGCAIFRLDRVGRAQRMVLQDVLLRPQAEAALPRLREVLGTVHTDLVQYYDSTALVGALLGRTLPTWKAFNFTVGMYDQALGRSPLEIGNWSLTLGDLQEM